MSGALRLVRDDAPSIDAVRAIVAPLIAHLRVETAPADTDGWIGRDALNDPEIGPLAELNTRFVAAGFGANRRAVAASLMLRHGWAAGFVIATWLSGGMVARIDDYALKFSAMTLVEAVWIRAGAIELPADAASGRRAVAGELRRFSADLIASQHAWSRLSRHALWAMVTSSWAAQFASVGDRIGERTRGMDEARRILALDCETAAAAPDLYEVAGIGGSEVCQRRAACCLYFKGPRREFCASCPVIPAADRLARNRAWASRTRAERRVA